MVHKETFAPVVSLILFILMSKALVYCHPVSLGVAVSMYDWYTISQTMLWSLLFMNVVFFLLGEYAREINTWIARLYNVPLFLRIIGATQQPLSVEEEVHYRKVLSLAGVANAYTIALHNVFLPQNQIAMAINKHCLVLSRASFEQLGLSQEARDFIIVHEAYHLMHDDTKRHSVLYMIMGAFIPFVSLLLLMGCMILTTVFMQQAKPQFFIEVVEGMKLGLCGGAAFAAAFFSKRILFRACRNHEFAADEAAARLLGNAGGIEFLEKVKAQFGDVQSLSHPSPSQRIAKLQKV